MKVLRFRRKFKPPCRYFPFPRRPVETGDIWKLQPHELQVYLYLCFKLWGFGKSEDSISYKQMREGIYRDGQLWQSGLGLSERTLRRIVRNLEKSGWIRTFRKSRTEPLHYEVLNPLLMDIATGHFDGRSSDASTGQ